MKIDVIKQAIPNAISEEGGAIVHLVNKQTVPLETSVKEAKDGLYVIADEQNVKDQFMGLFKSMVEGVSRDGHARQIGDFLTVYPVVEGVFDLEKGWDEDENSVRLRARLLNEMTLDITKWTFNDVTPGRAPFKVNSVTSGGEEGTVIAGAAVNFNGIDFPAHDDLSIEWKLADGSKSGTIAGEKFTSDATRVDLAAGAVEGLAAGDAGKEIEFTFRGNFAKATLKAVAAAPAVPTVTKLTSDNRTDSKVSANPKKLTIEGTGLGDLDKSAVAFSCMDEPMSIPATASWTFEDERITIDNGDVGMSTDGAADDDFTVTITKSGFDPVVFSTKIG